MLPNRKRKLPTWMERSVKPGLVAPSCSNKTDDISPKSPILSLSNSFLLSRSSDAIIKENPFDISGNVEHPARENNTSAGGEDELNDVASTSSKTTYADSDYEENCELTEGAIVNNDFNNASQSTSTELNTVRKMSADEDTEDQSDINSSCSQKNDINGVGTDSGINLAASVYSSPATRKSCFYGSSCYRKNPQHRKDFAHPGDSDYCDSSNNNLGSNSTQTSVVTKDVRPLCEYGSACYRKNPQHRRDFRHDTPKKRNARPVDMLDIPSDDDGDFNSGSESDNYNPGESESDDSFVTSDSITDGNSDYDPEAEEEEKTKIRKRKRTNGKKGEKKVKGD